MNQRVVIFGEGHLAYRLKKLVDDAGYETVHVAQIPDRPKERQRSRFQSSTEFFKSLALETCSMIYVVDEDDERNLEAIITIISLHEEVPITASLYNENIAPHLQAAHPNLILLNPAKIAAPAFVVALDAPVTRTLRYHPISVDRYPELRDSDWLFKTLAFAFGALIVGATVYFYFANNLSWFDSFQLVVVTVASAGYNNTLLTQGTIAAKLVSMLFMLGSLFFIWIIFSLAIERITKKRLEWSLGHKRYHYRNHVVVCGLGRLGFFVVQELINRKEQVIIIESNENRPEVAYYRSRGIPVYIGQADQPRVLEDVGVQNAKALISVIGDDYANLEIGLNARSFKTDLQLILRIFDESMAQNIKKQLDIHLTQSMSAIADGKFFETLSHQKRTKNQ